MSTISCTIEVALAFIVITRLKLPHICREFFVTGQGTSTVPRISYMRSHASHLIYYYEMLHVYM
jgi:hypothetical protein